ncbi:MAG: hypothetical protein JSS79_11520 [Bacteroidetes bacterium]|nr:hypothetical protein [Bacteroidota bacterium]
MHFNTLVLFCLDTKKNEKRSIPIVPIAIGIGKKDAPAAHSIARPPFCRADAPFPSNEIWSGVEVQITV